MKLSHLEYIHRCFFLSAVVAALFMGMVLRYSLYAAEMKGRQEGRIETYIKASLRGLSEQEI